MKGLVHYHFIYYARTYKYVPPLTIFIIMLLLNYATVPNPIMYSYSFTALLLFFMMGWFTISIVHTEDLAQKQITIMHARHKRDYYLSPVIICFVIGLLLSSVAVVYPIAAHSFGPEVHTVHVVTGLLAHFSLAILSIGLSVFFTRDFVKTTVNSWWGVIGALTISTVLAVAKAPILKVKLITFILPPVRHVLETMTIDDKITSVSAAVYAGFGWVFAYGLVLIGVYIVVVSRR